MRTRWVIMDLQWSKGCRLNRTCVVQALPPIDGPGWTFGGAHTVTLRSGSTHACHLWTFHSENNAGYGAVPQDWHFFVDAAAGAPVKLDMRGLNWFSGGHWDHYIAEFYEFAAAPALPPGLFEVPAVCDGVAPKCAPSLRNLPSPRLRGGRPCSRPFAGQPLVGGHHT